MKFLANIFLCLLFWGVRGEAYPLELIPSYQPIAGDLTLGLRTDLWTSPYLDKDTPVRIYNVHLGLPFYEQSNSSTSLRANTEGLSSGKADLVVGNSKVLIGSDLRCENYGIRSTNLGKDSSWSSITVSYDSASDEPYRAGRDDWAEVTATYAFAPVEDWQWIVAVNYSKNRGYLNNQAIPLIGVNYTLYPNLVATVGLPFFKLFWDNKNFWTASLAATPTGIRGLIKKKISEKFLGSVGAGISSRSYLHQNRIEDSMRLFYEEHYLESGLQTQLSKNTSIQILLGYSYDRNFYEAKQIYDVIGARAHIESDYYGKFQFEVAL